MSQANQEKRRRSVQRQARKNEALKRINGNRVTVVYPRSVCRGQKYLAANCLAHSTAVAALV